MFAQRTENMVARWRGKHDKQLTVDVIEEMTALTLDIAGQTLFGLTLDSEIDAIGNAFHTVLGHMHLRNLVSILLPWLPTRSNRRYKAALRDLHGMTDQIIQRRRAMLETLDADTAQASTDLLSRFMLAKDADTGERMSDEQLHDEVLTMLLAGHETTSMTLTWAWYLLATHPEKATKLRAELDTVLGKGDDKRLPILDDISRLPYTKMIIQETLRLYPPAWAVTRTALDDDEIDGYHIAAGSNIFCPIYAMHHHPDLWDDPDTFVPERFTPERMAQIPKFAYLPFGGGPRQCIGNHFAMLEAQMVLATVAHRVAFHLSEERVVEPVPMMTLRPKGGLKLAAQL
ncbi:MAG: cytochrome P450 [Chloroflexota bacterium]